MESHNKLRSSAHYLQHLKVALKSPPTAQAVRWGKGVHNFLWTQVLIVNSWWPLRLINLLCPNAGQETPELSTLASIRDSNNSRTCPCVWPSPRRCSLNATKPEPISFICSFKTFWDLLGDFTAFLKKALLSILLVFVCIISLNSWTQCWVGIHLLQGALKQPQKRRRHDPLSI